MNPIDRVQMNLSGVNREGQPLRKQFPAVRNYVAEWRLHRKSGGKSDIRLLGIGRGKPL